MGSIPTWNGKLYSGDSSTASIRRAQENESIACSDPKIDGFICMSEADFQSFISTYVLGCKQWAAGTPRISIDQAYKVYLSRR